MKNMKLWKTLLIAISVAVLPFALIGVGQAQQLTCWGLRPNLTERTEYTSYSEQHSIQKHEDITDRTSETENHDEDKNDPEDSGSR
jgi:hypothetical protein